MGGRNLKDDQAALENDKSVLDASPAVHASTTGSELKDMAARLRRTVDCDRVRQKAIAYDKASFRAFRDEWKRKPMPLRRAGHR